MKHWPDVSIIVEVDSKVDVEMDPKVDVEVAVAVGTHVVKVAIVQQVYFVQAAHLTCATYPAPVVKPAFVVWLV
jgi:hypothetical protein